MPDYYKYDSLSGIIVPDTGEVQTDVENEFLSNFGADMDMSPSSPQGRLVEMETLSRVGVVGFNALVANQINIDYATGQFLDAIGAFFSATGPTEEELLENLNGAKLGSIGSAFFTEH